MKYTYAAGAWVKYTHEPQVLSVPGKGLREGGDWSGKWEVGRWGLEWEVDPQGGVYRTTSKHAVIIWSHRCNHMVTLPQMVTYL